MEPLCTTDKAAIAIQNTHIRCNVDDWIHCFITISPRNSSDFSVSHGVVIYPPSLENQSPPPADWTLNSVFTLPFLKLTNHQGSNNCSYSKNKNTHHTLMTLIISVKKKKFPSYLLYSSRFECFWFSPTNGTKTAVVKITSEIHMVQLKNYQSEPSPVNSGVPQGSV